MASCKLCNNASRFVSKEMGVCLQCIRQSPKEALPFAMEAHGRSRAAFGLPARPPKSEDGLPCNICVNECRIPPNGVGYCGLRKNENGSIVGVSSEEGKLSWYHDPLPTNCVAQWVCPGGTGAGFPSCANRDGPETGFNNLAVFFQACSMNCLYCQNWHFRQEASRPGTTNVRRMVKDVDDRTSCICYFGGDPTPQLPFALKASRMAVDENPGRILRICFETNGTMHQGLLDKMMGLSLKSCGCVKFDLKAWDENLHTALTGISNRRTIANFEKAAGYLEQRNDPPLLVASTLLVPGYIDEHEVRGIARFIASKNAHIPYSLLAFHPDFYMTDLPVTSRSLAEKCLLVAREEGLKNVRIGNVHLLS
jgi:pyruvate formate lyase activating enzyme